VSHKASAEKPLKRVINVIRTDMIIGAVKYDDSSFGFMTDSEV